MARSEPVNTNESGYSLKDYRSAIRQVWLPVVGRKQLGSHEYEMARQWYDEDIPLSLVLKAIDQVVERAKRNKTTIYSLGVITADLQQLRREQAELQAGAHAPAQGEDKGWQQRCAENLYSIADETDDPEFAAMCRELARDLPGLTEGQFHSRWAEIRRGR